MAIVEASMIASAPSQPGWCPVAPRTRRHRASSAVRARREPVWRATAEDPRSTDHHGSGSRRPAGSRHRGPASSAPPDRCASSSGCPQSSRIVPSPPIPPLISCSVLDGCGRRRRRSHHASRRSHGRDSGVLERQREALPLACTDLVVLHVRLPAAIAVIAAGQAVLNDRCRTVWQVRPRRSRVRVCRTG
jgi:hypothetical protein